MKEHFKRNLINSFNLDKEIPQWLVLSNTLLLPKSEYTNIANNYRPIALQNSLHKAFTAIITGFIMDHCTVNNIVTEEQAVCKPGSWGCADQLLINKIVSDEVIKNRRYLITVWLDYKKAFDSIPHNWIIEILNLAKIPDKIIDVIKMLMSKWRTKIHLYGETESIETSEIEYYKGILQGDMLSLILFVLSVNPSSFILHKKDSYKIGKEKTSTQNRDEAYEMEELEISTNLSHLLFINHLKFYTVALEIMKALLEIVTRFSHDVGMKFGEDKCAYQCIKRGERSGIGETLTINNVNIAEIEEGDHYKYLGIDESVGYNGLLNKQRIIKEYKRRVNKIWKLELNAINKSIAHNIFAVPIITPTIGILNWTKQEIKNLDTATRKLLTMNGSFHQFSDTNRLYAKCKDGGRGIKNIEDLYKCRTIALMEHLEKPGEAHGLLKLVKEHEKQGIVRLGYKFRERIKEISKSSDITEGTKKIHKKEWIGKMTHGYHQSQIEGQEEIDSEQTNI